MATSPTQVVVEGKAAGNSSLILWDASGRSQILDVAVDLDIAGLRSAIQRSYPKEQLDVEADAGRLVLPDLAAVQRVPDRAVVAGDPTFLVVDEVDGAERGVLEVAQIGGAALRMSGSTGGTMGTSPTATPSTTTPGTTTMPGTTGSGLNNPSTTGRTGANGLPCGPSTAGASGATGTSNDRMAVPNAGGVGASGC